MSDPTTNAMNTIGGALLLTDKNFTSFELEEMTKVSRTTVRRIIRDLRDMGHPIVCWMEGPDWVYSRAKTAADVKLWVSIRSRYANTSFRRIKTVVKAAAVQFGESQFNGSFQELLK